MNTSLVTGPVIYPVSLEEVKNHLRIDLDETDGDAALLMLRDSAIEQVEDDSGLRLLTQTWDYTIDCFPDEEIRLPGMPLQSVTSVTYINEAGDSTVWSSDDYVVHTGTMPGKITRAYNEVWPTTREIEAAVTVRYVCGYTTAALVPKKLKHAILLAIGTGDKFRENMLLVARGEMPVSLRGQGAYDRLVGLRWRHY